MIGKQRLALTSLLGFTLACLGLTYVLNLERIQRCAMEWIMVLRPDGMLTNLWQNPSLDMTANVYIFNWTNSEDLYNPDVKPRFEELGPYTFHEKVQKTNVVWNPENSTVSYLRKSRFYFDEAASVGKLTDNIVSLNTINVGIYNKAKNWSPMLRTLVFMALHAYSKEETSEKSVEELLFKGYDTPLLKMSKILPSRMLPELQFPYERIGYGYPRNDTSEVYGRHNVYTGQDDFSKLGQMARWRDSNVSFAYPECKMHGSTGEYHKIPLVKDEPISYFLPDLCREMKVDFAGVTDFNGIEAYVYKGSARNMANGTDNPENSCYCQGSCEEVRSGLMNVSTCWYNVPVFVSYPHFYQADPYYLDAVEGLKPDSDRHEMLVVLEPKTGMLLDIKARLMISLLLDPHPQTIYRNAKRTFFPLVWVDYRVRISPELQTYLKLLPISTIVGKICGILTIAAGLLLLFWYPRRILLQKHFMQNIEISNVESRLQAADGHDPELKNSGVEGTPLLVGLQYVKTSADSPS